MRSQYFYIAVAALPRVQGALYSNSTTQASISISGAVTSLQTTTSSGSSSDVRSQSVSTSSTVTASPSSSSSDDKAGTLRETVSNVNRLTTSQSSVESHNITSSTQTPISESSSSRSNLNGTATRTAPANGTITAAPTCRSTFKFWGAAEATRCLNCPQENGTWLQSIPENLCSTCTGENKWLFTEECKVIPGTVSLLFFPTATANGSNEGLLSTYYDSIQDFTYTSPSIYFHLNTLSATNKCGPLGPTASNAIFAYNLNDVSTLKPTPIGVTTEYRRETAQLQLSDLAYSCPSTEPTEEEAKSYVQNDVNRCNPRLAWPMDFKRFGYPYWKHCGSHNYKFGVYDPPRALTAHASVAKPTLPQSIAPQRTGTTARPAAIDAGQASKTGNTRTPSSTVSAVKPAEETEVIDNGSTAGRSSVTLQSTTSKGIDDWIADGISAKKNPVTKTKIEANDVPDMPANTIQSTLQPPSSSPADIGDWIATVISAKKVSTSNLPDPEEERTQEASRTKQNGPTPSFGVGNKVGETTARIQTPGVVTIGTEVFAAKIQTANAEPIDGEHSIESPGRSNGNANGQPVSAIFAPIVLQGASRSFTIHPGEATTVNGQDINLGSSEALIIGSSTVPVANPAETETAGQAAVTGSGGQILTAISKDGSIIVYDSSKTLTIGNSEATTIAGERVEAASAGGLIVAGSTVSFAPLQTEIPDAVITGTNGQEFEVNAKNGGFEVEGESTTITIRIGDVTTFAGKTLSAASGALLAGTSTIDFAAANAQPTGGELVTLSDGKAYTVMPGGDEGDVIIKGSSTTFTLDSAEATVIAGQTISAVSDGLLVGTSTLSFESAKTTTSPPTLMTGTNGHIYTVEEAGTGALILQDGSTTFTLSKGQTTVIDGQTISAGHGSTGTAVILGNTSTIETNAGTPSAGFSATASTINGFQNGTSPSTGLSSGSLPSGGLEGVGQIEGSSAASVLQSSVVVLAACIFGLLGVVVGL